MGRAGNRGFGAGENDLGVVGDLSADPNAATHARGKLFSDRQYTVKIAGVYRFAHDVRVGATARYQDGQAFSRMVVIPGRMVLFIDAYNVVNTAKEVEEWVVTGPAFRTPTAVQPPRAIHRGLRFSL